MSARSRIAMRGMRFSSRDLLWGREATIGLRGGRAANALPGSVRSVRAREPPHGELDAVARQLAPGLDLGHVGGLGEAAEHLAGLLARGLARQREGVAA